MSTDDSLPAGTLVSNVESGTAPARSNGRDEEASALFEDDLGTSLIREVHDTWQVDAEWSVWQPRGFSWWGHRYRQRVWSEPGCDDDGFLIYRLCAETDVVRDLPADANPDSALAGFNTFASLLGLVHLPDEGRIVLHSSVYAHAQTASWAPKLLAQSAILQPILAERLAPIFTAALGGDPDERGHPEHGFRPEPDEMLGVMDNLYIPEGQGGSPWSGSPEFEQVAAFLNGGNCFSTAGPDGLVAEFPFGPEQTSMLRVDTRERHPMLGSGLLLRLHLPLKVSSAQAAALAGGLNRLERNGGVMAHALGGWTTGDDRPVYVTFVPTVMYQRNVLQNAVLSMGRRAMNLSALLCDEDAEGSVVEIVSRRMGIDPSRIEEA